MLKVIVVDENQKATLADISLLRGMPGKDAHMVGPPGRDGIDGKDAHMQGPPGQDGKDGAPGAEGPRGPKGFDGKDGAPGVDGRNGKDGRPGKDGAPGPEGPRGPQGFDGRDGSNFDFPNGKEGEVWTATNKGPAWRSPQNGIGYRTKFGLIESRLVALEAGGGGPGGGGTSSVYVQGLVAPLANSSDVSSGFTNVFSQTYATSLYVNSFYALKSSIPDVSGYATSAHVSSGFATFALSSDILTTSQYVNSFYALKSSVIANSTGYASSAHVSSGFTNVFSQTYATSLYVNSFYALKSSVPDVSGYATSAHVSSANATFTLSSGIWASSQYVNSFYALKSSVIANSTGYASSADVTSRFANLNLSMLADVNTNGLADLSILKWSNSTSKWIVSSDNAGSGTSSTGWTSSSDIVATSQYVNSFYPLKTDLSQYATSAHVSSGFTNIFSQTYTTSLYVNSFYALKSDVAGGGVSSAYVNSFYPLKTDLAQYATSADVSSANATWARSIDVASTYADFMGQTETWSLAAPASRTIANSIGWSFCITSTTITSAFITMPQSPFDGQEIVFGTIGTITFLTQTVAPGSTQLIRNRITTLAAGAVAKYKWTQSQSAWFKSA